MAAHKANLQKYERDREHMKYTAEMGDYVQLCVAHNTGLQACVLFLCERVYEKHWLYIKNDPAFSEVALKIKDLLEKLMEKHPRLFTSSHRNIANIMCNDATPPALSKEPEPTPAARQLSEIEEAIEEKGEKKHEEEVRKPKKQKPESISPPAMQLYQDPDAPVLSSGRLSLDSSSSKSNSNIRLSK